MPEKRIIEKARKDKREGKSPTTQAGEFIHESVVGFVASGHRFADQRLQALLLTWIVRPGEQGADHRGLRLSERSGGEPREYGLFDVPRAPTGRRTL